MHQTDERRSSPRQPYAGIVEVCGVMAFGNDISKGGVSFYLRRPLAIGTLLDIAAGGSVAEPVVIRTPAVVARVDSQARGYLVGVRFAQEIELPDAPAAPATTRTRGPERLPGMPRPKLRRRDFRTPFLARTLR